MSANWKYFGVFDFFGWKAAVDDKEVERHLGGWYYAAWIETDGRIHSVNYHEAHNPTGARGRDTYAANYANGLIRWYGLQQGLFGLNYRKGITKDQADTLIKMLYWFDPSKTEVFDETTLKEFSTKGDAIGHIRQLQHTA